MDIKMAQEIVSKANRCEEAASHIAGWRFTVVRRSNRNSSNGWGNVHLNLEHSDAAGKRMTNLVLVTEYTHPDEAEVIESVFQQLADEASASMQLIFEKHRQSLLRMSSEILSQLQSPGTVTVKADGNIKVNVE